MVDEVDQRDAVYDLLRYRLHKAVLISPRVVPGFQGQRLFTTLLHFVEMAHVLVVEPLAQERDQGVVEEYGVLAGIDARNLPGSVKRDVEETVQIPLQVARLSKALPQNSAR